MIFKVAILQSRAENSNIKRNIDTIICSMEEASKNGADILLLPECFITGYELPMTYEKSISCEDEAIVKICETAKKYCIGVVLTSFTKGKERPQNTAFVINKSGEILMKYSKVHTCDFADEKDVEAGTEFKVCDFDGIKIGIMICYDRFWKLLKDKGISQYRIVQSGISHSTLTRLKRNEGVNTDTLDELGLEFKEEISTETRFGH